MKYLLVFFILLIGSQLTAAKLPFSYFKPPTGWLMTHPKHLDDGVKIGFVESEHKIFTPAISLSTERISCDEKTYLDAVKKNHKMDPTHSVRELGFLQTKSGKAHLFQIDLKNNWGKIRILQSILIKDDIAYIQTASCLREDFLKTHQQFLECFRTLTVLDHPLASLSEKKESFEEKLQVLFAQWKDLASRVKGKNEELFKEQTFQKHQWVPFTKYITKHYKENGICWQILAIQHIKDQLIQGSS